MSKQPEVFLELAHGYATLDHRRVFDAATSKVARLTAAIGKLLEEYPQD